MQKAKQHSWILALFAVLAVGVACSSMDDIVGQRRTGPTPTVPVFATATPGGRISVWLITPTGQIEATLVGAPPQTLVGEIVGPAATATAAFATVQAATAAAAVTLTGPNYQPGDCPEVGGPVPPQKPNSFSQYPEIIGLYLSSGGPTTILESTLRSWGAIQEGAVVQSDTDLTGDGTAEIIVSVYDPSAFQPGTPAPGQLLVYGCAQKGYRLLYSTTYSPQTMIPELKRVGDMNSDVRAELAFTQLTCLTPGQCTQIMQILAWNANLGTFKPVNDLPINANNAKAVISDLDSDGNLEISVIFAPPTDPAAGPPRRMIDVWDWDGTNYVLALTQLDPPAYRIHALNDGDLKLGYEDWSQAIRLYDRVRDDQTLLPWDLVPNEAFVLRSYATYKKILAMISNRQIRATGEVLSGLQAENPPGSPGEVYATLAQTFLENYGRNRDRKRACTAVLELAATRLDALTILNNYGYANRIFTLTDLCPFTNK
jgi:hypothetical protein